MISIILGIFCAALLSIMGASDGYIIAYAILWSSYCIIKELKNKGIK